MRIEFILKQLEQAEAQIRVTANLVGTLRNEIEEALAATQPPQEPETDEAGNCLHPADARQPAPSMGQQGRFWCARCRQFGGKE